MNHSYSPEKVQFLLEPLRRLQQTIRDAVVTACEQSAIESLSAIAKEEEGDTIYAVDRISEEVLIEFFGREIASRVPIVLIAEGLPLGKMVLPHGAKESDALWRI